MKRTLMAAMAISASVAISHAQAPAYRVVPLWPQPLPNHKALRR